MAQSCPFAVNPYLLYLVQSILCKAAAPAGGGCFHLSEKVVIHIHTFLQKARRTMKSERAEANYFSTVFFIFIAVVLLAFIIDLFGIISTKQELDHAADQMVKQIQLSGGINSETDSLFEFLCSEIEGAENITYRKSPPLPQRNPLPAMSRPPAPAMAAALFTIRCLAGYGRLLLPQEMDLQARH